MFVKRTVKRRGETSYEYLALVEAVRVEGRNTDRTLFRLGEVSELKESGQGENVFAAPRSTWAYAKVAPNSGLTSNG